VMSTPTSVDMAAALLVVCVGFNYEVSVWYYLTLSFYTFCFLYFDKKKRFSSVCNAVTDVTFHIICFRLSRPLGKWLSIQIMPVCMVLT